MPIADPPPNALQIPCGHCGFVVGLSIARLPAEGQMPCPDCRRPIALYLSGLCEDIVAASQALARFRAVGRSGRPD